MYCKETKKEIRENINQLWKLLHRDSERFSESLERFGKEAIESDARRSLEIMFATYLSVMIKVDNRLFIGHTYWDIRSRRVDRVYRLLFTYGYAERIVELALGAANLYDQTKHKAYGHNSSALLKIAEEYKSALEQHRQKYDGDVVDRKAGWDMIRASNCAFAKIYDIVEAGTTIGGQRSDTYFKSLEGPTERDQIHELYMDTFDRLVNPRKYAWKSFLNRFKPRKRNKRKKIDWKTI